ncbi:hypothetical protein FQR65_LT20711 [Abscondita terminalis]|nr:hypothetical protein FQR65_LT20711 [Abscondita terminalis]
MPCRRKSLPPSSSCTLGDCVEHALGLLHGLHHCRAQRRPRGAGYHQPACSECVYARLPYRAADDLASQFPDEKHLHRALRRFSRTASKLKCGIPPAYSPTTHGTSFWEGDVGIVLAPPTRGLFASHPTPARQPSRIVARSLVLASAPSAQSLRAETSTRTANGGALMGLAIGKAFTNKAIGDDTAGLHLSQPTQKPGEDRSRACFLIVAASRVDQHSPSASTPSSCLTASAVTRKRTHLGPPARWWRCSRRRPYSFARPIEIRVDDAGADARGASVRVYLNVATELLHGENDAAAMQTCLPAHPRTGSSSDHGNMLRLLLAGLHHLLGRLSEFDGLGEVESSRLSAQRLSIDFAACQSSEAWARSDKACAFETRISCLFESCVLHRLSPHRVEAATPQPRSCHAADHQIQTATPLVECCAISGRNAPPMLLGLPSQTAAPSSADH